MDTPTKENFEAARAPRKLGGRWRIWEGFQKGKNKVNYADLMAMVFPIETMEDVGYLFNHTSYGTPSKFFFCVEKRTSKKYQPVGYTLEVGTKFLNEFCVIRCGSLFGFDWWFGFLCGD